MVVAATQTAWKQCTLGDLFRIKHGFAFKGEFFASAGHYILLTPGNFRKDGGLKLKGDREKYYAGPVPAEFLLKKGDLLVVMTDLTQQAPILGSPAFIPQDGKYLHNQRLGKVIDWDADEIDAEFLYYLLNLEAVRAQIRASATGATVRHTSPDRIYAVQTTIPPLRIQRKIAAILSAYDDLIENDTRRIAILEQMAQALYREWFVEFRFPGHEHVRMVDSPLGPIPEGWEVVPIGAACSGLYDGPHATPPPSDDGPVFLGIKNVTESGRLDLADVRHISEEDFANWTRRVVPSPRDMVFTYEAALHRYAMIPKGSGAALDAVWP